MDKNDKWDNIRLNYYNMKSPVRIDGGRTVQLDSSVRGLPWSGFYALLHPSYVTATKTLDLASEFKVAADLRVVQDTEAVDDRALRA
jgi:hypothetical protein